jgi:L-serine kinase (ATP) / ParB family transcriptional regulator, heme-responsive regulator
MSGMSGAQRVSEETAQSIIPDLRIVPIDSLIPHEEHDTQRAQPLVERIQKAGSWLNPPVVAPMDESRYVILDGANRHYALGALGYTYILVQIVDYESDDVKLTTWHHIVSGMMWFPFLRHIYKINGIKVNRADLLHARAALARREVLAYVVLGDNKIYTLETTATTLAERTAALRNIVNTYKESSALNRIATDRLSQARQLYPNALAIIVFPHYEPVEIILAARDGVLLPPGISRHIIRGRAMRLNYPLEAFRDTGESLDDKNRELQRWIQRRMAEKRVRYYDEPTYLFDE